MQKKRRRRPRPETTHERLNRLYGEENNLFSLALFVGLCAVLVIFAFSIFGARNDKAKFTTDLQPTHIRLGSIDRHSGVQM